MRHHSDNIRSNIVVLVFQSRKAVFNFGLAFLYPGLARPLRKYLLFNGVEVMVPKAQQIIGIQAGRTV
jgi:hypothetical protein